MRKFYERTQGQCGYVKLLVSVEVGRVSGAKWKIPTDAKNQNLPWPRIFPSKCFAATRSTPSHALCEHCQIDNLLVNRTFCLEKKLGQQTATAVARPKLKASCI